MYPQKTKKTSIRVDCEDFRTASIILGSLKESIYKVEEDDSWTITDFNVVVERSDDTREVWETSDFNKVSQEVNIKRVEEKAEELGSTLEDHIRVVEEHEVAHAAADCKLGYIHFRPSIGCFLEEEGDVFCKLRQIVLINPPENLAKNIARLKFYAFLPSDCRANLFLLRRGVHPFFTHYKKDMERRMERIEGKPLSSTNPFDVYWFLSLNVPWKLEKGERLYRVPESIDRLYSSFESAMIKYLKEPTVFNYHTWVNWILIKHSHDLLPKIEGKQLVVLVYSVPTFTREGTKNFELLPLY